MRQVETKYLRPRTPSACGRLGIGSAKSADWVEVRWLGPSWKTERVFWPSTRLRLSCECRGPDRAGGAAETIHGALAGTAGRSRALILWKRPFMRSAKISRILLTLLFAFAVSAWQAQAR